MFALLSEADPAIEAAYVSPSRWNTVRDPSGLVRKPTPQRDTQERHPGVARRAQPYVAYHWFGDVFR